jgi:hypothetical protein
MFHEDKPMAVAVKTQLQIQSLVIMMFYTKRWIWKITGYVVDLSTTFDADVQTFH